MKTPVSDQQDKHIWWDLYDAAYKGDYARAVSALDRGADIHAQDGNYNDAMDVAIEKNHLQIATLLIGRGYNIHKRNDHALRQAVLKGHTEIVSLLLDRGADIYANKDLLLWAEEKCLGNDEMLGVVGLLLQHGAGPNHPKLYPVLDGASRKTSYLFRAYDDIEQSIAKAGGSKAHCAIAYQAAVIGLRCGMHEKQVAVFVDSVLKRSLEDTMLSRIPEDQALDPAQFAEIERRNQPEALVKDIGIGGYLEAGNIRDMVSEYADVVLLPRLLLEAKLSKRQMNKLEQKTLDDWSERLMPQATQELFSDKRLDEILAMSKEWHINGNAIPHELRPYLPDRWQKLVEDVETPFEYEGEKLVIRALSDKQALIKESDALGHCVGRGGDYVNECATGNIHILSVQTASGRPLATREVELTDDYKQPLRELQFRGQVNTDPPAIAKQAMDWFDAQLKEYRIRFNTPHNGKWGQLAVKSGSPAIQRIGYEPNEENIKKCLDHYEQHLRIKQPFIRKIRREGAFVRPSSIKEDYRWVSAIRGGTTPSGDEWRSLIEEAAAFTDSRRKPAVVR